MFGYPVITVSLFCLFKSMTSWHRARPCLFCHAYMLGHIHAHCLTRCRTLFTERHANWTIGGRCKHDAPAHLTASSTQPVSFELLKKHSFEWRRAVIALLQLVAHARTKNRLCLPKVVNDKPGECEAPMCEMCATGEEKRQSLSSWIPPPIWRRLTKQNSHSRSHTFHTLSTQLDSSGGRGSFHAASAKGQSHVTDRWFRFMHEDSVKLEQRHLLHRLCLINSILWPLLFLILILSRLYVVLKLTCKQVMASQRPIILFFWPVTLGSK